MASIPAKVSERLAKGIKQYRDVLESAKSKDVSESDTVLIVVDMLADVFGYQKLEEVTSEHEIKGTYCDLAIKLAGKLEALIEVKAIGADLKDQHVKQAVDYAANQGVDWVVLTNAAYWRVYRVHFEKPIDQELVTEICFSELEHRNAKDIELLFLLCKEAWKKSALEEYENQRQALGKYLLAAVMLSDPVLKLVRRELRSLCPNVKIDLEEIQRATETDVLKREVLEGDKADRARRKVSRAASKAARAKEEPCAEHVGSSAEAPTATAG